jgi:chromosome partitioning protein
VNKETKKYTVLNYKGGTGKTCILVNIAHYLAKKGFKILIVDTDPQGSTSYHLGINSPNTLYDVITNTKNINECIISARKNLDIIISNERLFPAEIYMHQQKNRENILSDRLKKIDGQYDYILLDCSPSINLMNQNALLFSKNVMIPVSMEYMSLVGIKQLIKNIQLLNKTFNDSIKVSKIIPTFYDKNRKKSKSVLKSLDRVFSEFLTTPIRTNISISEAAGFGQTIFEFDPKSKAADDFKKLSEEVIKT